LSPLR